MFSIATPDIMLCSIATPRPHIILTISCCLKLYQMKAKNVITNYLKNPMILNYHHSSTSYQSFSILNGSRSSRPQSVIVTSFIGRSFCPVSLDSIRVTTSWIEKLKVSLII